MVIDNQAQIDGDLRDLDLAVCDFLVPRLKAFKDKVDCMPNGLTFEEWQTALSEMIEGFEEWPNTRSLDTTKLNHSLELLKKYFLNLWY